MQSKYQEDTTKALHHTMMTDQDKTANWSLKSHPNSVVDLRLKDHIFPLTASVAT